eukprot:gene31910-40280_t
MTRDERIFAERTSSRLAPLPRSVAFSVVVVDDGVESDAAYTVRLRLERAPHGPLGGFAKPIDITRYALLDANIPAASRGTTGFVHPSLIRLVEVRRNDAEVATVRLKESAAPVFDGRTLGAMKRAKRKREARVMVLTPYQLEQGDSYVAPVRRAHFSATRPLSICVRTCVDRAPYARGHLYPALAVEDFASGTGDNVMIEEMQRFKLGVADSKFKREIDADGIEFIGVPRENVGAARDLEVTDAAGTGDAFLKINFATDPPSTQDPFAAPLLDLRALSVSQMQRDGLTCVDAVGAPPGPDRLEVSAEQRVFERTLNGEHEMMMCELPGDATTTQFFTEPLLTDTQVAVTRYPEIEHRTITAEYASPSGLGFFAVANDISVANSAMIFKGLPRWLRSELTALAKAADTPHELNAALASLCESVRPADGEDFWGAKTANSFDLDKPGVCQGFQYEAEINSRKYDSYNDEFQDFTFDGLHHLYTDSTQCTAASGNAGPCDQ